jgi:hypothetical protein
MATTKAEIREWLEEGKKKNTTHMLVVCDTFDWEDYPVYVRPGESVIDKFEGYKKGHHEMQKVMEVYALHLDWNMQLSEGRSFHFEDPPCP